MTHCTCTEDDCTNSSHPAGNACRATGLVIAGKQVMAGWKDDRCPGCQPQIIATVRAARDAQRRAKERFH